jgi:phage terminase small subunit
MSYDPPKGLHPAGLALWNETIEGVQDGWRLDSHDLVVLEECCRLRDMEARLQRRVDREGILIAGSEGQQVTHPALRELRMTRALVLANIRRVEIARPRATTGHLDKRSRDQLRDARAKRWR